MSEERTNGIGDPAVSGAYRETATERAPASLNEAVLRHAAAHAKEGYAHSMLWMRPLAWAATVILSLAVVVQVVTPPSSAPELPAAGAPAVDDAAADLEAGFAEAGAPAAEDDPLKRRRDQEVREESKIEEIAVPAVAAEPVPESEIAEEPRQDAPAGQALDADAVPAYAMTEESLESAARQSAASIRAATDMARLRAGRADDYAAAASDEESVCEGSDIESAASWADCIERLEELGRFDEARAERSLLREAFPDFEWPAD